MGLNVGLITASSILCSSRAWGFLKNLDVFLSVPKVLMCRQHTVRKVKDPNPKWILYDNRALSRFGIPVSTKFLSNCTSHGDFKATKTEKKIILCKQNNCMSNFQRWIEKVWLEHWKLFWKKVKTCQKYQTHGKRFSNLGKSLVKVQICSARKTWWKQLKFFENLILCSMQDYSPNS